MPIAYEPIPVHTFDGFALTLWRSAPEAGRPGARPVLLLPGLGSNRYTFGVRTDTSLAASLNAGGRDVYLLDFRGARSSAWQGRGRPPVTMDHKLHVDVPAAVATVRERTGADALDLVGHSLGGLLAYLYAGGPDGDRVGRMVTLAAPGTFEGILGRLQAVVRRPARLLAPLAGRLPGLGVDRLARVPGPLAHAAVLRGHMARGALDRHERRAWLDHGVEDLPGSDLAQLMQWAGTGRLTSLWGEDYDARLAEVRAPTLVMAAGGDRVVPAALVEAGFRRLGTPHKAWRLVGRATGASREYAHADLLLARAAVQDVHPSIAGWLDAEVATAQRPAGDAGAGPASRPALRLARGSRRR